MRVAECQFDGNRIQHVAVERTQDGRTVQVDVSLISEPLIVDYFLRDAIKLIHDHQDVFGAPAFLQPCARLGEDHLVDEIVNGGQMPPQSTFAE